MPTQGPAEPSPGPRPSQAAVRMLLTDLPAVMGAEEGIQPCQGPTGLGAGASLMSDWLEKPRGHAHLWGRLAFLKSLTPTPGCSMCLHSFIKR